MTAVGHDHRPGPSSPAPGLSDAVAAEWSKLRSWPAGRRLVVTALALAVLGAAAFTLTTTVTDGRTLAELDPHDRMVIPLLGVDLSNIIMIILAVVAISGELASGMTALTLQIIPRRRTVLAAKLLVLLGVGCAVSVGSVALAFGTGQLIMLSQGLPLLFLTDPTVLRLLLGTMLMVPLHLIFGATLAFCLRGAGQAVVGVFVIMCLPSLARLLPGGLGDSLQWLLPSPSLHTLSGASRVGDRDYTDPITAVLVLTAWVVLLTALAMRAFRRRNL